MRCQTAHPWYGVRREHDGVCIAIQELRCSNLIFSFDPVKWLYLQYMSLFKFMRSDWVLCNWIHLHSVLRMPSQLIVDNNMTSVSGLKCTLYHQKRQQHCVLLKGLNGNNPVGISAHLTVTVSFHFTELQTLCIAYKDWSCGSLVPF